VSTKDLTRYTLHDTMIASHAWATTTVLYCCIRTENYSSSFEVISPDLLWKRYPLKAQRKQYCYVV